MNVKKLPEKALSSVGSPDGQDTNPQGKGPNGEKTERQLLLDQMEQLKTDKIRRQVEELERERQKEETPPAHAAAPSPGADTNEQAAKTSAAPPVPDARIKLRHVVTMLSFVMLTIAPVSVGGWYLWARAHDRYVSYVGFSVRTEEIGSALEFLGGVAELSGSSSSDTDILYKFIQSSELVAEIDKKLGLRAIWSAPGQDWANPGHDPYFSYHPPGSIEDLTDYWNEMVGVYSDSGTGLVDIEVEAFNPQDAQNISRMIYDESSKMINQLSAIGRDDATRYARSELEQTQEQLRNAREILTRFRNETQIIDPAASIQAQMGLLSSLHGQLAQTLIDLDILRETASESDPRIVQGERRIEVIERRIATERSKLGFGKAASNVLDRDTAFADLVGEYERLSVDLQFAQESYTSARAAYETSLAEAQRQSRYLAAHVKPTLPESPTKPKRFMLLALIATFCFLLWSIVVLTGYALRDRR